ncbi:MAG: hypothetical protein ACFB0C_13760 [Leptolyngbyaceae cyanobacterium]
MIALGAAPSQNNACSSSVAKNGSTFLTHESLVQPFKYWDKGLHDGIFYQGDLYGKGDCYGLTERDIAFDAATQYTALGKHVCITVSNHQYILWVALRVAR